jgi:HD-like signal output (HDOD) protein
LQKVVADPHCDFDGIAEIIDTDPSLSPRLSKIRQQWISWVLSGGWHSFLHAIEIVGVEQLMQLVLSITVVGQLKSTPKDILDTDYFRRHSAQWIFCTRHQSSTQDGKSIFVAGLLHETSRLVIYLKAPDQLKVVIDFVQKMETTGINPKLNISALIIVVSLGLF